MPISAAELDRQGSDAWWLKRLASQMHARPVAKRGDYDSMRLDYTRNDWLDMLWARYTGNAPLSRLAERYAAPTQEFLRMTRTNFAGLVVEALRERTQFIGARSTAQQDVDGDDAVRSFISSNGAFMQDALTYSYSLGIGFVMVSPPQPGEELATATAEDPRQIAVAVDPVRPNVVKVALKLYRDEDAQQDVAHLYRAADENGPDRISVAVRDGAAGWSGVRFTAAQWSWDNTRSGALPVQGLGVPLVPFDNRLGMGEFEPHLDLLDRITNDVADRLWASKFQIFIQRAIMGNLPQTDPVTGAKIDYNEVFSADPGALWQMPENAKMWESRQIDINALLAPVRDDLKELSAVTGTPLHMFTPDAMTGSAEGASLARESITFKAEDRIARFKPQSSRLARLGLAYSGKPYTGELESMWAPVERYSLAQRGQAGSQARASGIPDETIWSDIWQFPPETIVRMRRERTEQALYADVPATPPVATNG